MLNRIKFTWQNLLASIKLTILKRDWKYYLIPDWIKEIFYSEKGSKHS